MGCKVRHLGGYKDGNFDVNPLSDLWVQGQPLKFNTAGLLELCKCYREAHDDGYCGLAVGHLGTLADRKSDIYNGKAAYYAGYNQLKLDAADPENHDDDDYPYDTALVYTPGDDLYINELGFLTNIGPGGGGGVYTDVCLDATPIAYVLAVASTYMIINQVR
jgi:hypothetical protein